MLGGDAIEDEVKDARAGLLASAKLAIAARSGPVLHSPMPALEYPHIVTANGESARMERLPRIRVAQIAADHIGNGWSAEEIIRQYPHLTAAEVHTALAYYYDHREAIDAELATEVAALDAADQQAPTALRLRLLSIRRVAMA